MSTAIAMLLFLQPVAPEAAARLNDFEQEKHDPVTGELPVDPYEKSNRHAGAKSFNGQKMADAFGGQEGIARIADSLVDISIEDPRIGDIFKGQDMIRLRRTLFEQFCYILNAGCDYSGRDMKSVHQNLGIQRADLNALVENLQQAMAAENIPFRLQNRFLAKLAPMSSDVVER